MAGHDTPEVNFGFLGKTQSFDKIWDMKGNASHLSETIDNIKADVRKVVSAISSHQLRVIYNASKKAKTAIDIQLLRPKMLYLAARAEKKGGKKLIEAIEITAAQIKSDNDGKVESFKIFLETIVAFHKYMSAKQS